MNDFLIEEGADDWNSVMYYAAQGVLKT